MKTRAKAMTAGNILLLRGDIQIHPPDRDTVSYEYLSQRVADYLLTNAPDVDISAALSMMPLTTSRFPPGWLFCPI
jgi:hypothetical protein